MTKRKPFAVSARPSFWGSTNGSQEPVVRLYAGAKKSVVLDYTEIPALISELAKLLDEHLKKEGSDD